ncbi:hypothetical protein [Arachidicoccus terrestris]|uniref:hypothetical protein n=1 Tax=Arachidicoccus terrestris TaxID=2875539 RepID=UPI001CC6CFE4|nr:hypothetical protein [Arachidicoccus terrestris]UAY56278.1 hypothetical protein K9M52_04470 [Arachidicoccus terrestris]
MSNVIYKYGTRLMGILAALFIGLILITATSCSSVKKLRKSTTVNIDSTATKSRQASHVNKKDSAAHSDVTASQKSKIDSGYSRKTVVREYWTNDFDLGSDTRPNPVVPTQTKNGKETSNISHTSHKKGGSHKMPGKLLYRETTTYEKGNLQKETENNTGTKQGVRLINADSLGVKNADSLNVNKGTVENIKTVDRKKLLSGIMIVAVIAVICFGLYKWLKK